MNFLYVLLTIVLLPGAACAGWWLCARKTRRELADAREHGARRLAEVEESARCLAVELGRARSECDGQALALEEAGDARERLEGELASARAAQSVLRAELASLRGELAARAASLELARAVAREAEEVRDAQQVELEALRAARDTAEQQDNAWRAEQERRRVEQAAAAGELRDLRAETVHARREASELRHEGERQAAALAQMALRLAGREAELAELAARLERTAGEVVAVDARAHRLEAELEERRASVAASPGVHLVREAEDEPEVVPQARSRRTRVTVPVVGQGDLWAE